MVKKIYLRTSDKDTMIANLLLYLPSCLDEEGTQPILTSSNYQVILLPTLFEKMEEPSEEPPTPIPGYHVNIITSDETIIESLSHIRVYPKSPLVRWS